MPLKTDELRTQPLGPMPTPAELGQAHPITDEVAERIAQSRRQIERILTGEDQRLLVIVGPCSVHDTDAAIDYATRLASIQEQYKDQLFIVMRTYFEKPRTVVGWKGLITDPNLDGSYALEAGLNKARKLLLDLIHKLPPDATPSMAFRCVNPPEFSFIIIENFSSCTGNDCPRILHDQIEIVSFNLAAQRIRCAI